MTRHDGSLENRPFQSETVPRDAPRTGGTSE